MKTPTLSLLWAITKRDLLAYKTRLPKLILNWIFIYPLMYGFAFAYIQGPAYFATHTAIRTTELFAGNILLLINGLTFDNTISLLEDLTGRKHINFLRLAYPLWLDLLRRVLLVTILCLFLLPAYFPMAKIVTGSLVITTSLNWIQLISIIIAGALYTGSMHLFGASLMKNVDASTSYWARFLTPLTIIGGLWVPLYAFANIHPALAAFAYINPYTYITEGTRYALLQEARFMHTYTCIAVLLVGAVIMFGLAYKILYKRLDHVGW